MAEPVQVLVAEKSPSLAGLLVGLLEQANYTVAVATTELEAMELVRDRTPEVVISSVSRFDGEGLCKLLRKQDRSLPLALVYPPTRTDDIEARGRMFGADLVLVGPIQKASLLSAVRLLIRLRRMGLRSGEPAPLEAEEPSSSSPLDVGTFKRMLHLEVNKSRRYHFPAAFLLLHLDPEPLRARNLSREEQGKVVGAALAAMTKSLRDIDLCVHAGNGRFTVFLPHTPFEGARVVAARLHARLRDLRDPPLAVSVGLAAYDGEGPVSFGSLMRDATASLESARGQGGDRVGQGEAQGRRRDRVFIA